MDKTYENFEEWLKEHDAGIRNDTIERIHTKLVSAFNEKYSFNDSHLLEFEVLDIIADTINQMKGQNND